jgi:hypothetical protein
MASEFENKFTSFFDQASQSFSDSLKQGAKMQEEASKWWTDALSHFCPATDAGKKANALLSEAIPTFQKNAQEFFSLLEQNYKRTADLLKKAFQTEPATNSAEAEAKTRELWNASVGVVRDNAQAVANTNLRVMQLWADALNKGANGLEAVASKN